MAQRPNGLLDRFSSAVTMITNGLPSWWLGMIMIMVFSYAAAPLPLRAGLHSIPPPRDGPGFFDFLWHLSLPLITLVLSEPSGAPRYLTRNIVLSNLQEDYVMAAARPAVSPSGGSSSATRCAPPCPPS